MACYIMYNTRPYRTQINNIVIVIQHWFPNKFKFCAFPRELLLLPFFSGIATEGDKRNWPKCCFTQPHTSSDNFRSGTYQHEHRRRVSIPRCNSCYPRSWPWRQHSCPCNVSLLEKYKVMLWWPCGCLRHACVVRSRIVVISRKLKFNSLLKQSWPQLTAVTLGCTGLPSLLPCERFVISSKPWVSSRN